MQSHAANCDVVARAGYTLVESFVLPEHEWWDGYYSLIDERIPALRAERTDAAWQAALDDAVEEADIVRACGGSFGYVFYVMRRV